MARRKAPRIRKWVRAHHGMVAPSGAPSPSRFEGECQAENPGRKQNAARERIDMNRGRVGAKRSIPLSFPRKRGPIVQNFRALAARATPRRNGVPAFAGTTDDLFSLQRDFVHAPGHTKGPSMRPLHPTALALAFVGALASPALAQDYPSRTVSVIVPYPPG